VTARIGRSYTVAALATALLAIAGCGGSSAPKRSKHAVFVPRGVTPAPPKPSPTVTSETSTDADSPAGSGAKSSAGRTAKSGSASEILPGAKLTFAAPGEESQTAFASSADAICRSFRARARAIGAGATTLVAQETELPHLVAATEQAVKALTELSPPTGDEPRLRNFVSMTAASLVAFAEAQSRTRSTSEAVGADVEAQDLADSARSSRDATAAAAAAKQLGLHVCGSPGAAWL
jgi:hypothetical protein